MVDQGHQVVSSLMEFTRLPARGKSSFDELYAEIREWLGHRKCPNQIMLFGKTFYDYALSFLMSERMNGRVVPVERFYGRHLFHYTSLEVFKALRTRGADLMCTRFSKFPAPELVGGKLRYALHQTSSTSRRHYTPRCIRCVMLSPHGNKDFNRILAKDIIGSGNDPDCPILESLLPYNGK